MLPHPYYFFRISQERHEELLREAERERLIRQAYRNKSNSSNTSLRNRILSRLGDKLIDWGCRIRERYEVPLCATPTQVYCDLT